MRDQSGKEIILTLILVVILNFAGEDEDEDEDEDENKNAFNSAKREMKALNGSQ